MSARSSLSFLRWSLPCRRPAWLLAALLSLARPVASQAAWYGDFAYEVGGTAITITDYACTGGDVVIPDSIDGMPVTTIGNQAFSYSTSLASVAIPGSVTTIGDLAFSRCASLTSVYFMGDAPLVPWELFYEVNNLTVYYLPSTTGWGSTYADRPTALWIPIVPDPPSVTADNPLRLVTSAPAPAAVHVQRSPDLLNWKHGQTVTRDRGPRELLDSDASSTSYRFYRGVEE